MSKVILQTCYLRKAISAAGAPSPECPEIDDIKARPRHFERIRKLHSHEVAKVATVLDFSDDLEPISV
jgi:hypothetical protein